MSHLLKKIWGIYWYISFAGLFLLLYPAFLILLSNQKYYYQANRLRKFWARLNFLSTGIIWKIEYSEGFRQQLKNNPEKGMVICPNHSSFLDIPGVAIAIPGNFRFMAKSELGGIPIFNIFFKTVDIPVNRMSKVGSINSLKKAAESLDKRMNIIIFPEATTNNNAPQLLRFKKGAFKLAIQKQVPVVPVTLLDNWKLFLNNGKHAGKPGVSRMIIHDPVDTTGMEESDVDELMQKIYSTIDETLKKEYGTG